MLLEEGKTEAGKEIGREGREGRNGPEGISTEGTDAVKGPAPGIVMRAEEADPSIERGGRDLPVFTQCGDGAGTLQVQAEDVQDKSQGVRTEGDEDIREDGMGMSARLAKVMRDQKR